MTYQDVRIKLRLHIAERQTTFNQEFQILGEIAKAVFGNGKEDERNMNVVAPKTAAEASAGFHALFGGSGMTMPPPG